MDIGKGWQLLIEQCRATSGWEWLAVILGVSEVLLARANRILLYPAGILSSAISIYVLTRAGLYGESVLSSYYIVMSVYGWWHWAIKKNTKPVKVSYCTTKEWWIVLGIVAGGYAFLTVMLTRFTPSTVPQWDAFVTATAWAGMWLLARRKIENWILLNVSNAVAIPLLWKKQLPLFAALTVFLFIVAVEGYYSWRKKIKEDAASPASRTAC